MSDNDVSQIKERIARLETKVEEKWESHDKRADERWADLMDKIHEMQSSRVCVEHSGLLIKATSRIESIERWQTTVNWAVGVIYAAAVGIFVSKFLG